MKKYLNYGCDSSVQYYDIASDSITVYFSDGSSYTYSYASTGMYHVERMKELAEVGEGLNHYIMKNCKYDYE